MGMVPQMSPIQPGQDESALEVQNVTPGVYRVVVVSGSLSYPAAVSSGTTDLLREPLRVVPGEVPRPIEVTLRDDFGSISGTVLTGSAAQPPGDSWVPEFTIVAIPLDKPEANADQMIADYAHRFTMPHVAPGRYLLMASHQASPRTLEFRNEDVLRGLLSQGTVVTVSSGQKVEVQLPLMPEAAE
jgi:hypothetical protein